MVAELDAVQPSGELMSWTVGSLGTVLGLRAWRWSTVIWLFFVAASIALLGFLDWSPSDIANQATMLALLLTAGCLGFALPGGRLATGLILGSAVALLHLSYLLLGVSLPYQPEPSGVPGAISLFVLVLPATVAAAVGGTVRRRASRRGA
ncbi:MAG: hypothetical protein DLM67_01055 [Candidatus Nephthysia bennettiae]|nr:MAG: hypothetical protein DLM67_01055 [Candidatus Dormibacteraeota bacterium]